MAKRFELAFADERQTSVIAELLEEEAPITAENLWEAIGAGHRARLHHGRHCAAELWCYLPTPKEEIPYENSTVYPRPATSSTTTSSSRQPARVAGCTTWESSIRRARVVCPRVGSLATEWRAFGVAPTRFGGWS